MVSLRKVTTLVLASVSKPTSKISKIFQIQHSKKPRACFRSPDSEINGFTFSSRVPLHSSIHIPFKQFLTRKWVCPDTLSVTTLQKQKLASRNIFKPSHLVITTTEHQDFIKNYYVRQMPNKAIHVFRAIS